jgi:hypothetical protein
MLGGDLQERRHGGLFSRVPIAPELTATWSREWAMPGGGLPSGLFAAWRLKRLQSGARAVPRRGAIGTAAV